MIYDKTVEIPSSFSTLKDACASKNIFQSNAKVFQDVSVVKKLNKAKFPVYLVSSNVTHENFAMKVFMFENDKPHIYYKNEMRFAKLQHKNVIKNLYLENERKTKSKGIITKVSYKIMEFAPYGDFFDFVMKHGSILGDKLSRTYFRQLIEGLEYLHSTGVCHLDLKLDNLLIGKDFQMKIADFDLSYCDGDAKILSKGTKFYRAPEIIQAKCKDTRAADIYATGIVLFTFKTQGILPHAETNLVGGCNFANLLHEQPSQFWREHCDAQSKDDGFFDEDFKELFISMTKFDPSKRATIADIKKSKWFNGPVYSTEELTRVMEKAVAH